MSEERTQPTRWRRWRKRLFRASWIGALLLVVLYATREATVHPLVRRAAGPIGRSLGIEVSVEDISGSWFGGLALDGLHARPLEGEAWRVDAEHASGTWSLLDLVRGHEDWLARVTVDDARVEVRPDPDAPPSEEPAAWPAAPTWLPELVVDELDLIVHRPDGSRIEILDLAAIGTHGADAGWALDLEIGAAGTVTNEGLFLRPLSLDLVYVDQWIEIERIDVDERPWIGPARVDLAGLALGSLDAELEASGPSERTTLRATLTDGTLRADLQVDGFDLEEAARWWPGAVADLIPGGPSPGGHSLGGPSLSSLAGELEVRAQVEMPLDDWTAGSGSLRVEGGGFLIADRTVDTLALRATLADGVATVSTVEVVGGATTLTAADLELPVASGADGSELRGSWSLTSRDLERWIHGIDGPEVPEHELLVAGRLVEGVGTIERGSLVAAGARIELASGSVRWPDEAGAPWPVTLAARADVPDLGVLGDLLGRADWAGSLRGSVDLEGTTDEPLGRIALAGEEIDLEGIAWGAVSVDAALTDERVDIARLEFDGPHGRGSLDGAYVFANESFEALRADVQLAASPSWEPWITSDGAFAFQASLDGPWRTPTGSITVDGTELALGDAPLDVATLRVSASAGAWTIDGLEVRAGDAAGLVLAEPARVVWTETTRSIEGLALAGPSGTIRAEGSWSGDDATFEVALEDLRPAPWLGAAFPSDLALEGLDATLRSTLADGAWRHTLSGDVEVFPAGPATGEAVDDLAAGDARTDDSGADDSGTGDARAGLPVAVRWDLLLDDAGVHVVELAVDRDGAELVRANGHLPLDPVALDPWLPGDVSLTVNAALPESLRAPLPRSISPRVALGGGSRVQLDLGGPWRALRADVDLDLRALEIAVTEGMAGELLSPGRARLVARLRDGGLILETVEIDLPHDTVTRASGTIAMPDDVTAWFDPAFDALALPLELDGRFGAPRLGVLGDLLPNIQRLEGSLDATFDLGGTLNAPTGTADLTIADGLMKSLGAPLVDGIAGACRFEDGRLTIDGLTARLGAAPVTVQGTIEGPPASPTFAVDVDGSNVLLVRDASQRVRADLDLTLAGPLDALVLSGDVALRNSRVNQSIDLLGALEGGSGFQSQQSGLQIAPFESGPLANLAFDLRVDTAEAIALSGNLMRGSAKASLHVTGTGRGIHPDGAVSVQETILSLPGGSLTLTGGTVRFSKANPAFPTLDVYGETRMIGYDVNCHVTGSIADPVVALSSSPPLPQDAILILLLTGRLPSEASGQQAAEALTIYIARDALRAFLSDGMTAEEEESFLDRFEYESGREISNQGVVSLEARFRIADEVVQERDAIYIVAERDRFEDFNLGLRFTVRLK